MSDLLLDHQIWTWLGVDQKCDLVVETVVNKRNGFRPAAGPRDLDWAGLGPEVWPCTVDGVICDPGFGGFRHWVILWKVKVNISIFGTGYTRRSLASMQINQYEANFMKPRLWAKHYEANIMNQTLWAEHYEPNIMSQTLWAKHYEPNIMSQA